MSKKNIEEDNGELFDEPVKTASKGRVKLIISTIIYLVIIILITTLVIKYVGMRTQVVGNSMYPTLKNGDSLIIDKLFYKKDGLQRFDVVVFLHDEAEEEYYIKRVIALPGETVQIKDSVIYVNGTAIEDPYGYMEYGNMSSGIAAEPVTLGEGEYFCMGDNRNHSTDSRDTSVGVVKQSQILGKAILRIYPFDSVGWVK